MSKTWWFVIRVLARICVRIYYRACRVEHAERIPRTGPVLFVVNHPNAVMDAAVVLRAIPRPLSFAAKSTLFSMPIIGWMLRKLGAVPVYRPRDRTGKSRENLKMFSAFTDHFRHGDAAAIFPEGHSHLDPELRTVKSGPARIALEAAGDAEFGLGLQVVAVGLHYEPKQQFRGEVHVRIGEPFGVADLADTPRREAIGIVRDRVATALRPLVLHLDRTDLEPLVRDVVDVYEEHTRLHPGLAAPRPRADLLHVAGACLNHFLVADPTAVDETRKKLRRYHRLARAAGLSATALAHREKPWRFRLHLLWLSLRLLVGVPIYAFGILTSYVPYRATDRIARHFAGRQGRVSLPTLRIVFGALSFAAYWGALAVFVLFWSRSVPVTFGFLAVVAGSAHFARYYAQRVDGWWDELRGLAVMTKPGARRLARARQDLLVFLSVLLGRYQVETGSTLLPPRKRSFLRFIPWRSAAVGLFLFLVFWFARGMADYRVEELSNRQSPWVELDADRARATVAQDARTVLDLLASLDRLEEQTVGLKEEFGEGLHEWTSVATDQAIRQTLLIYLQCRASLYRVVWYYRGPDRPGDAELSRAAFTVGYAAALELVRRGIQFVAFFEGNPAAVRKLNEGDPAWNLPPGTFDRIRRNLANTAIQEELIDAAARFRLFPEPADPLRQEVWKAACFRTDAVAALAAKRSGLKWDAAVARVSRTIEDGRYAVTKICAKLIGRVRIREGDLSDGLIDNEQVSWLRRERMQPGDIMLERRNWALSNVFLPGFWTHAALYVGGREELEALGIADDPRVLPHLDDLGKPDDEGHRRDVLEALAPGVVLNSLEHSVGEADAVCVFRPRLSPEQIGEAIARAFAHRGKPYDFDFDFFSTDRLVCTELIHQAYDGPLTFRLRNVMGRATLPAMDILRLWVEDPEKSGLQLVCFLDCFEADGVARESDIEALHGTLERPGLDLIQSRQGTSKFPRRLLTGLLVLLILGLVFLKKRKDAEPLGA